MRNQKNERGITLVALVVTIVVLLILAGITIMYVMQGDSIFNSARQAKSDTNDGVVQEALSVIVGSDLTTQLYTGIGPDGKDSKLAADADVTADNGKTKVGEYVTSALKTAGMEDGTNVECATYSPTAGIVLSGTIKYKGATYTVNVNTRPTDGSQAKLEAKRD